MHLRAAPQPYAWEIVYRFASPERLTSVADIRTNATSKQEIDIDFLGFLRDIRWEDAKKDPAIRRKAGPVLMIVDCYDRVQPKPPNKPTFETLYITRTCIFSDENRALEITPRIRKILDAAFTP
jgi:hypothetical protein